jgi:23S rRNA (guanine745-N1)-methyltransferase
MIQPICQIVRKEIGNTQARRISLLDVGCGEGSHLANLVKKLGSTNAEVLGVGMDISKDAVRIASREMNTWSRIFATIST